MNGNRDRVLVVGGRRPRAAQQGAARLMTQGGVDMSWHVENAPRPMLLAS
jgi:hypothetical protein